MHKALASKPSTTQKKSMQLPKMPGTQQSQEGSVLERLANPRHMKRAENRANFLYGDFFTLHLGYGHIWTKNTGSTQPGFQPQSV